MSQFTDRIFQAGPRHRRSGIRLAGAPSRLGVLDRMMAQSIVDPQVEPYRRRALFTFFRGKTPPQSLDHQGQLEGVGRCLDWFVFDYTIPTLGLTPAQHWFKMHTPELSAIEWIDARDCLKFTVSLFVIEQVHPGKCFIARDLLRDDRVHLVNETIITDDITPGQLLVARLFPHRSAFILSGTAVVMDASCTGDIQTLLDSGRIDTAHLVEHLDALELDNMICTALSRDTLPVNHLPGVRQRLVHYVTDICSGELSESMLNDMIKYSPDPDSLTRTICRRLHVQCRHETKLIAEMIASAWNEVHSQTTVSS